MKALIILLLSILAVSCSTIDNTEANITPEYYMMEENVHWRVSRLENKEAVCYKYNGKSISCFKK